MLTSIVGINWGDEGKGRMVDLLSQEQDIVVRYQGGNNAGHTVINDKGKFVLNLLPSAILREDKVNVMGNGMVVDIEHLCKEIAKLREGGIVITPDNLKISDKAVVCCPYNVQQDCLEEDRLGDKKFGSTRRGISPIYADKYMKKAIRMGDILHPEYLRSRLETIVEWKNLTIEGSYHAKGYTVEELLDWFDKYGTPLKDYICDTGYYLDKALKNGKNVMLEAQLGALRDIDFGIYPYTTSSSTITAYGPVGAGIPNHKVEKAIGVMKAYSTCVGEGPFTAEMFGEEAEKLRKAGGEYGAATGRPRRVGGYRSSSQSRRIRRRRIKIRLYGSSGNRNRTHQTRYSRHDGKNPRLRQLRRERQDRRRVPLGRSTQRRNPQRHLSRRLELPHHFLPSLRGSSPQRTQVYRVYRKSG